MSLARANLIVGPARNAFNSGVFFTNKDYEIKPAIKRFQIRPLGFSQPDERDEDRMIEWEPEPDGRWNTALIAALWPYLNSTPGASMAGSADVPYVAHGADGGLLTVIAAYVKKMPDILFSSKKSLLGSVGFRGVLGNSLSPSDASAYVTYAASGATFPDSTFDLTQIKTQPYTLAWTGFTGFSAVVGEEGFHVSFNVQSKEIYIDGLGTVDERIQKVSMMIKCKPVGPTAAQILTALKLQGTGNALGSSRQATAAQAQITGADGINYLTTPKATLVEAGYRFGDDVLRNGEIAWVSTMSHSAGVQAALAVLAAS